MILTVIGPFTQCWVQDLAISLKLVVKWDWSYPNAHFTAILNCTTCWKLPSCFAHTTRTLPYLRCWKVNFAYLVSLRFNFRMKSSWFQLWDCQQNFPLFLHFPFQWFTDQSPKPWWLSLFLSLRRQRFRFFKGSTLFLAKFTSISQVVL